MNKVNSFIIASKMKEKNLVESFNEKISKKENGDETLLVKIMLIVIAVFLVIIFRDTLKGILTTLLTEVQTKIQGMYQST